MPWSMLVWILTKSCLACHCKITASTHVHCIIVGVCPPAGVKLHSVTDHAKVEPGIAFAAQKKKKKKKLVAKEKRNTHKLSPRQVPHAGSTPSEATPFISQGAVAGG
mmetsp:Transcript_9274/g.24502  ORF Transcript_9274/g.24502 Transcript_9274/m.24502 type:complete len:107 (-) Transcript_9274:2194-2514(-)